MRKFYITGAPGTGKSTVAEELEKHGIPYIDLDRTEDRLTHWRNKGTSEISHWHAGIGTEFFENNSYLCDVKKLVSVLDTFKNNVVVMGVVDNQFEFLDLFDKVFLLQCSEETFIKRITERKSHDFGYEESERKWIVGWYKDFEKRMIEKGAILINTEEPLTIVVDSIIRNINS
jgi:broad-specificity NMP kinase